MTDFNKGKWIKWTATDENGTFSHVGEVYKSTKSHVTFVVADDIGGHMTVEKTDGVFENVRKSKSAVTKIGEDVRKREAEEGSRHFTGKKLEVFELVVANPGLDRKEYIALIVEAGISTPAGASTFYNAVRKAI